MTTRASDTKLREAALAVAVAAALNRRVGENRGITVKQFAHEMGVGIQTVWSWQSGNKPPSGRKLIGMIAFFDASFASEILSVAGKGAYCLRDARAAKQAERVTGTAAAIRAIAAIAPLLAEEPVE